MKFYGRTQEIQSLERIRLQSLKSACFTVVVGRRRIGKTSLILESVKGEKFLYLFVSRKTEYLLCADFQKEAMNALGLQIYGEVTRFRDIFQQLLQYATKEHLILIMDEFQDLNQVNPSIFSEIQNLWDQYKDQARIHFIACGSIYSLMMRIFEHNKEPLFGRLTSKMMVKPFPVSILKEILRDHNPGYTAEDLLCFYMLTGGVAKYITLLIESGAFTASQMMDTILLPDSPFLNEGRDLLVSEFGKEYNTYFSILQLIATGKTLQSEIDSIIGKNTGAYLTNLEKEYSLICRNKPIFARPESRKARWSIRDNFLQFWFRFLFPNQSLVEMGKLDMLREYVDKNYDSYSGVILEKYFRDMIAETLPITDIGSYWDNKGEHEIDVVAVNRFEKWALIGEVKRNSSKISLPILEGKAKKIKPLLDGYHITYRALSMEQMDQIE